MPKRTCDFCTKEKEVGNSGTKICRYCGAFACSNCGSGKTQCPKCHRLYK